VMTVSGLVPLTKAVEKASTDRSIYYTDKIQPVFTAYAESFSNNLGWNATLFPAQTALLVNVPVIPPGSLQPISYQLVLNTQVGSWCQFQGWNASSFAAQGNRIWFASLNQVFQAWIGTLDNGQPITAQAQQAYQTAGSSNLKHVSLIRPIISSNTIVSYSIGLDTDFETTTFLSPATETGNFSAIWDTSNWDSCQWQDSDSTTKNWQTVSNGDGIYFSLRLQLVSTGGTFAWSATNYVLQVGGPLG